MPQAHSSGSSWKERSLCISLKASSYRRCLFSRTIASGLIESLVWMLYWTVSRNLFLSMFYTSASVVHFVWSWLRSSFVWFAFYLCYYIYAIPRRLFEVFMLFTFISRSRNQLSFIRRFEGMWCAEMYIFLSWVILLCVITFQLAQSRWNFLEGCYNMLRNGWVPSHYYPRLVSGLVQLLKTFGSISKILHYHNTLCNMEFNTVGHTINSLKTEADYCFEVPIIITQIDGLVE